MISNDSLVVIQCMTNGESQCGERFVTNVEYIYVKSGNVVYGLLNTNESVVAIAELEGLKYKNGKYVATPQFHEYVVRLCKENGNMIGQG